MMGIGFGEMALIAGIALVVIGPEKFPDFAKIVVKTIRDIRGYVDDVKHEMAEELKPIKREMNQLSRFDAGQYIDALTDADRDASGPEDDVGGTADPNDDDPYAFNGDYGHEYQDYNPEEVPGDTVVETDDTSTDGKDGDSPSSGETGPDTAKASPEKDEDIAFDVSPPERID